MTIKIEDYGYDGEGVGRCGGKVVFVPYALKDEIMGVKILGEKSTFARGEIETIIEKSPKRESPPCPYFAICGGCAFQHTSYENELEIKRSLLARQMSKIGYDGEIEVIKSPERYGYRNKIRLFFGDNLSLKKRGSAELCPIEKCLLVTDKMNEIIQKISLSPFKIKPKEVIIRQENDQILVTFVTAAPLDYSNLYLPQNVGIFEKIGSKLRHIRGPEFMQSEELGLKCNFSALSFHQVNRFLCSELYKKVIENVASARVVNGYSGSGVLSGAIAKTGRQVWGIELGRAEHEDAENLKKLNNLKSLTNIHGDCAIEMEKLAAGTVIVDPPRAGLDGKVCQAIEKMGARRLIYISCNSATLVRDLAKMNYRIEKVYLFDLFAATGEYETLVVAIKM